jgi:hypothetical protein
VHRRADAEQRLDLGRLSGCVAHIVHNIARVIEIAGPLPTSFCSGSGAGEAPVARGAAQGGVDREPEPDTIGIHVPLFKECPEQDLRACPVAIAVRNHPPGLGGIEPAPECGLAGTLPGEHG